MLRNIFGEGDSHLVARVNSQGAEQAARPLVRSLAQHGGALAAALSGASVNLTPTSGIGRGTGRHCVVGAGEVRELVVSSIVSVGHLRSSMMLRRSATDTWSTSSSILKHCYRYIIVGMVIGMVIDIGIFVVIICSVQQCESAL